MSISVAISLMVCHYYPLVSVYQEEEKSPCFPNPCQNGSYCYLYQNEVGYMCHCVGGYTGTNCSGNGKYIQY
jgi:hypothetical protein